MITHQGVRKVNNTQAILILPKEEQNVNMKKEFRVKISIPEHIAESVKTQKINRIYDILSSEVHK